MCLVITSTKSAVGPPTAPPTALPLPTANPTQNPTPQPSNAPTPVPSNPPTSQLTPAPTSLPTTQPTDVVTPAPTALPSAQPTPAPTAPPSVPPTPAPTAPPSVPPTPAPTAPPTPAPTALLPPTTGEVSKTIVCGRGDVPTNPCSEGLKGTALVDEIHEVCCCLDCSVVGCSLPWKRKCPSFEPNIYARSKFAGVCKRGTFADALDFCRTFNTGAWGSRLCTPLEIENSCAKGTGCNFDKEQVWACAYNGHVCEVDAECCGSCVNGQCEGQ